MIVINAAAADEDEDDDNDDNDDNNVLISFYSYASIGNYWRLLNI